MSNTPAPILLGAYWAKWCPRRTHNHFDVTVPRVDEQFEYPQQVQARMSAGIDFEACVNSQLARALGERFVDLGADALRAREHIAATRQAMDEGFAVIAGGRLPDDAHGGRQGKPDLLVREADGGYLPADIKHHKALHSGADEDLAVVSTLPMPAFEQATQRRGIYPRWREDDLIQLAHYWRMLEACGKESGCGPQGAIIGSDELGDAHVLVWHQLDEPMFKTFSRTDERAFTYRTALQRHDHEHAFRVKIASTARQRTGAAADPPPLVVPIYTRECDTCPWFDYCASELGDGDASYEVGRLSPREWLALRRNGITTAEQLAALDIAEIDASLTDGPSPTARLLASYLPEVTHLRSPARRLRDAVRCAQMAVAGQDLIALNAPAAVPRADVEIDIDIETDRNSAAYLWGMLIQDRSSGTALFEHISCWEPMSPAMEAELAARLWRRITELIGTAQAAGQSVLVYHYAYPEPAALRRLAREGGHLGLPSESDVEQLIEERFVDLYAAVRRTYFGRHGLGLKPVATYGPGFQWRDEDPGGAQSQVWLDQVYDGHDPLAARQAQQRILRYNEDDVRATAAVREWMADSSIQRRNPLS